MEKYAETIGALNRRNFHVYMLDWRGQGLSDRALVDRHKGYVEDFSEYVTDLETLIAALPADAPRPRIFLAHSMGAHIALRHLHRHPDAADGLILVSPMIDIRTDPFPMAAARLLCQAYMALGLGHLYVPGAGDYRLEEEVFAGNRLTSDPGRFEVPKMAIIENPDLALGGATHAWVAAAFRSIDRLRTPGYLSVIRMPTLMVSASMDRVVSLPAQEWACAELPDCRRVIAPGARHEILMETDATLARFWAEFDLFMARLAGRDGGSGQDGGSGRDDSLGQDDSSGRDGGSGQEGGCRPPAGAPPGE